MLLSAGAVDIHQKLMRVLTLKVPVPKHLLAGMVRTITVQTLRLIDFGVENIRSSLEGGQNDHLGETKEKS